MDLRPLNYFEPSSADDMCRFELFGLANASVVPVMITMTPAAAAAIGLQKQPQQQQQQQQQLTPIPPGFVPATATLPVGYTLEASHQHLAPCLPVIPAKYTTDQLQSMNITTGAVGALAAAVGGTGLRAGAGSGGNNEMILQKSDCDRHYVPSYYQVLYPQQQYHLQQQQPPQQHEQQPHHPGNFPTKPHMEMATSARVMSSSSSSCIPRAMTSRPTTLPDKDDIVNSGSEIGIGMVGTCNSNSTGGEGGGGLMEGGCGAGCTALIMMGIGGVGGGGGSGDGGNVTNSSVRQRSNVEDEDDEGDDDDDGKKTHCNCTYMSFENFTDYQTTGFGGLPDVTEHSNIRRSITRQDSLANSDSADVASLQKSSKKHSKPARNQPKAQKLCIFSFSIIVTLLLIATVSLLVYYFVLRTPSRNSHDQRLRIVRHILRDIPLVDGHNNLPWNIRKYAQNNVEVLAGKTRELEQPTIWHRPIWSQTDISRLKEGLVGAQVWSAYVPCEAQGLDAVQLALEQIDIIHRFTELYPTALTLVTTTEDILAAHHRGELASLIGIEGGHALGSSLGVLRSFHSLGARYITLTNQCDISWASSSGGSGIGVTSKSKGLTNFGKAVVKEMNRLGMMIDLSHASDATVRDVLELTRAPVIFSNSAARSICNSSRNVPDDILRAVADNGGLIMIGFDSQHVSCDETSTLADVIAHIKYIRSIAGIEHIGIGARYDGMQSAPPVGLEDVSKYPDLLATLLEDSNWSEEDISMLAGKNFLRVLSSVENVRDYWKRAAIPPLETTEPIRKSPCTYMTS